MSKRLCVVTLLCALLTIVTGSAAAAQEKYSLAEALSMVGTEAGRANNGLIDLEGDFSQISLYIEQEFEYTEGKIIILYRQNPEKEYQGSEEPFSVDYEGKNVGEGHVFLCSALMESIPTEMRATKPEEVGVALVAETEYIYSGGYIRKIAKDGSPIRALIYNDDSLITIEEYRPIFVGVWSVYLYSFENNGVGFLDLQLYESPDLRKNPQADDIWQNMQKIHQLSVDVTETEADRTYAKIAAMWDPEAEGNEDSYVQRSILDGISERFYESFERDEFFFLSDEQYEQIASLAEKQRFSEVAAACEDIFWEEFEELKRADPDLDTSRIERDQNPYFETIRLLIERENYNKITMTSEEILAQKAYMGQINEEACRYSMNQAMSLFSLIEWDMTGLSGRWIRMNASPEENAV